jgi:hypothetical protein
MTNNLVIFACGGPAFGPAATILILSWIAAPFVFLINVCLIPFRPRRSILFHALFAGCCAGLGFLIWRNFTVISDGWIETLLTIGVFAVPIGVICQFVFLIVEMVRASRRRKQTVEIVSSPSSTAAKPA